MSLEGQDSPLSQNVTSTEPILRIQDDFRHVIDLKDQVHIGSRLMSALEKIFHQAKLQNVSKGSISIKFHEKNLQINLSVIGFLVLKAKEEKSRSIKIVLDVRRLPPNHQLLFKLKQYASFCFLFCDGILLEFHEVSGPSTYDPRKAEGWLEISRNYLPAFLIDRSSINVFQSLFKSNPDINPIELHWSGRKEYSLSRKEMIEAGKFDVNGLCSMLACLAYSEFNISTQELLKETLSGEKLKVSILNSLADTNNYAIIIFSILLIHHRGQISALKEAGQLKNYLSALLRFAHTQSKGVQEIAQNVIEHSASGRGVLAGRFFTGNELLGMHEGDIQVENFLQAYVEVHGSIADAYFFQIQLMDESNLGILDTYANGRHEINGVTVPTSLPAVYNMFRDVHESGFSNCLKSFARIGLVTFQKTILRADGFFSVQTLHRNEPQSYCRYGSQETEDSFAMYGSGTYYNVIIPQDLIAASTRSGHGLPFRKIDGETMQDLLSYYFIPEKRLVDSIETKLTDKLILEIKVPDINETDKRKYDFEQRAVRHACRIIEEKSSSRNQQLWLLNFKGSIAASNIDYFIRILAGYLEQAEQSEIIVLNVDFIVLEQFIELLKEGPHFIDRDLSFLCFPRKGTYVHAVPFPLLIAGHSYQAFIQLNRKYANINLDETVPENMTVDLKTIFIHRNAEKLLELDVIIEEEGLTLFEHYAVERLNQEIM